ncbi:hypothetical protein PMZ80_001752 [Knufia obscura]|uniref:Nephrocystin 3-like N-terminal domain-containing protein n=1 Tax=Knufia obscura TaxID=1635080 RepID=A0ABR0S520_9EURO|nr:hypothetical protein PMZ80_001752 [Knufia obscura]
MAANVLVGNANYTSGSASTIVGPSNVHGDMNIHVRNAFYSWNDDLLRDKTAEGKLATLKRALYYSSMDDRKAQLAEVEPASFEWLWTETAFPRWLGNAQSVFWISGKPGSGKSTLMHYLADSHAGLRMVQSHLGVDVNPWVILHFYFDFRAGESIANTILGMLRSLLLQLVDKSPQLVKVVSERTAHRHGGNWPQWENELLDLMAEALIVVELSICTFLDGLDEFNGQHRRLTGVIGTLQRRTGMKLCLASRPESALAFDLRCYPGLAMQNHNHGTIKAYIDDAQGGLQGWMFGERLRSIFQHIQDHAKGVLLWARFAVDEVISAVTTGYPLADIQEKLQDFPPELEGVYDRIWNHLGGFKLHAAAAFYIVENWDSSFRGCIESFPLYTEEFMVTWCTTLHKLQPAIKYGVDYDATQFKLRIYAVSKGLIEFVPCRTEDGEDGEDGEVARLVHKSLQTFLATNQKYTDLVAHVRTVFDPESFGPCFYAQMIIAASDELEPVIRGNRVNVCIPLESIIKQCRAHQQISLLRYTPACLTRALDIFGDLDVLDSPEHVYLLIDAARTRLAQRYALDLSEDGSREQDEFQNSLPTWSQQHREVHWFASRHRLNALDLVLQQYSDAMPAGDKVFIYACMLLSKERLELPPNRQSHPVFRRLVDVTLHALPCQIQYLALTLISSKDPLLEYVASKLPKPTDRLGLSLQPAPWWPHETLDVRACWVLSPYHRNCMETQRRRLRVLIDMGLSISSMVQEGQTMLQMLFDEVDYPWGSWEHLWDPYGSLAVGVFDYTVPRAHSVNFSKAKFDALMEYDVDLLARGRHGDAVESASYFIEAMKEYILREFEVDANEYIEDALQMNAGDFEEKVVDQAEFQADDSVGLSISDQTNCCCAGLCAALVGESGRHAQGRLCCGSTRR